MTPHRHRSSWRRIGGRWVATSLAVVVLCASGPGAEAQRGTREARDRHVFLTALDRNDVSVTDLKASEVVVKEDGAVREIISVTRASAPMQIAVLVDDSQAAQALTMEVRQGASAFVQLVAKNSPDSEMALWTFGERPTRQVDFTTSASLITRAIGSLFPRPGSGAYLMETLVSVSTELKAHGAARPVILAFLVEDGPEFSTATEQTVTYALKNAGAVLWVIVLQGHTTPAALQVERHDRALVISDGADASGGGSKIILDRMAVESAYAAIASRLTSQVDVAYSRPDRLVPPRKIDVTVTRPGVRVLAPRWARD
jgi:hypothetical protein